VVTQPAAGRVAGDPGEAVFLQRVKGVLVFHLEPWMEDRFPGHAKAT